FAAGAILAAEWIVGRQGFYEFTDVMEEILKKNNRRFTQINANEKTKYLC
ncbi:MAG: hypothetical protein H0W45_02585, partial [Acidobacteria bacterium]|nr:hypothetical protein [Acidobacteriota bacterium]